MTFLLAPFFLTLVPSLLLLLKLLWLFRLLKTGTHSLHGLQRLGLLCGPAVNCIEGDDGLGYGLVLCTRCPAKMIRPSNVLFEVMPLVLIWLRMIGSHGKFYR
uniref:Uncharacterized protein n=1 Tax=Eutreptiella gymnastica TaxID=73025 RepID=A0A7S4GJD1_9EUGL